MTSEQVRAAVEFLSVDETARLLNCSPATVRRRLEDRAIDHVVSGGAIRIDADHLARLLIREVEDRGIRDFLRRRGLSLDKPEGDAEARVQELERERDRLNQALADSRAAIQALVEAQRSTLDAVDILRPVPIPNH